MPIILPDHLLVVLLVLVLPIHGARAFKRFLARVTVNPAARVVEYRSTVGWQWGVFTIIAVLWFTTGRAPELLGVRTPAGVGFWIGLGVCAALGGFFVRQLWLTRRSADVRAQVKSALGEVAPLLPHTRSEQRWFSLLSLTAGIVEELAYRGFLLWYFNQFTGLWLAVAFSSFLFGVAHVYQGVGGMIKTGLAGLVAALLYVWIGSIWIPMLMHWLVDDIQGRTAFAVFSEDDMPAESAAKPGPRRAAIS